MIQLRTQTRQYWEQEFSFVQKDIDHLYNHFLETGRPQTSAELVQAVMSYRANEEKNNLLRRVKGRTVYQPQGSYSVGQALVFPLLDFIDGTVIASRDGHNPKEEPFKVITVRINGRERQFVAELSSPHQANTIDGNIASLIEKVSVDQLFGYFGSLVEAKLLNNLHNNDDFILLGGKWFVKTLLVEVNIGHLHLAEAVLEISGGGPATTEQILQDLELDAVVAQPTQLFSLNYALLNDPRFDEVAPKNQVAWFLRRLEPDLVQTVSERLMYRPIAYDSSLLSAQMHSLEREIMDEWSDLEANENTQSTSFTLLYPHRLLGTLPLNAPLKAMLPIGRSPRQIITLRDAETGESYQVWIVKEGRYLYGLQTWYEQNEIVVGAYLTVKKGAEPNVFVIDYDRRRPQREDIRMATVAEGRMRFETHRRRVGCGYDELQVITTDHHLPIDAIWRKLTDSNSPLAVIIAALLPELTKLSIQNAVHLKTLYSVVNMLRRTPPGPIFAELVRHPSFVAVGDQYWRFDRDRWQ